MTADGGEPKWLPCTRHRVEIVLKPGERDECRVKVICGVTESEDYDLLMGMRLLYAVGATICTWQEKVVYRPRFWRPGGPRGTLPVRFVHQEPKGAYQARMVELEEQLGEMSWYEAEGELTARNQREVWAERKEVVPGEILNKRILQRPIRLVELFGGLGTGLAAALKAGWKIEKWTYVEANPRVRRMAQHHVEILKGTYPGQIMEGATEDNWGESGHDVKQIAEAQVAAWGRVDVLIAGWECQGVSRAGHGLGLEDERSALFEDMVRIIQLVHRVHGEYLYVLENPDFALDPRELVKAAYQRVTSVLGAGVAMDAAQAGARSHRDRRYWQNGISEGRLRLELSKLKRPEARLVRDILEPYREEAPVQYPDHPALYQCNTPGEPREAWPTMVAYTGSYAFHMREGVPGPGMVKDVRTGEWGEPTALERELAMGFLPGATAAEGVAEWERKRALGQSMDVQAMEWLLHTIEVQLLLWDMEIQLEEKEWWAEAAGPNSEAQGELRNLRWRLESLTEAEEAIRKRGWPPGEEDNTAVKSRVAKRFCMPSFMVLGAKKEKGESKEVEVVKTEEKEWEVGPALNAEQAEAMKAMLKRHRKAFAFTLKELGKSKVGEMKIELTTEVPTYQRKRRMTRADEEICKEKCKELLEAGLIRRSTSEYAAATVVEARKDVTGEILSRRMCGDYRELNKITKGNRYPMPTPEDLFDKLVGARAFTTLDLRQGFNQIQIREADKAKTAFHGVDELWEWNGMPFGMKNLSAIFQQAMDTVLRGIDCAACYIDDVIVFSKDPATHVADVERVLGAITEAGLTCHPSKCKFGESTAKYLGFEVSEGTLSVQEAKVAVLDKVAAPTDRSKLRAVLGFLSYYRKFVPNFSKRAAVLNALLRESAPWKWGEEEERALKDLLQAVKTGPVLALPRRDQPFVLYTDWSSQGIGAVLCQETEQGERVVAFASRSCSPTEANYSSYEGEGLAAVWAVNHFRVYLQGSPFTLVTDHQPLTWLMTNQTLTGRNARWTMQLQEYDFKIRHRPGKTLQHVDGLSRNPPPPEAEEEKGQARESPARCLVAMVKGMQESDMAKYRGAGPEDIWEDEEVLRWVKGETEAEEEVSDRARARGQHYRWYQQQLQVRSKEGWKLVPSPEERRSLIVHGQLGHYGHVRTAQLLGTSWWWAGLHRQVREVVTECELCSRNKAQLEREQQELQSLPIMGLGYRWSLDLAGEMPLSRKNKRYVLVMMEHVSKWVEVRALSSKSAELIAEAFTDQVLTRFGACGEVLTDQGTEFKGAFDKLLKEVGITHRRTSRYHPQSDGLTERMVQTIKRGLRAYREEHKRDWDQELHWIVAGYRFSKQAALKDYSPYYLLYGKHPMLPVNAPKVLTEVVTAGTAENWAALEHCRAKYLKKIMPVALENSHTAQLRDAKRYQQRQQQTGLGKGKAVEEGTEVYLRKAKKDTLDLGLTTERWVVKEVKPSGVLVLESESGKQRADHVTNVAKATGHKMVQVPKDQAQVQSWSRKGASG